MKKSLLIIIALFGLVFTLQAQDTVKTKEQLKAERKALNDDRNSEDHKARLKEIKDLQAPGATGIASVDDLQKNTTTALDETKKNNDLIPQWYKGTTGETEDGVPDATTKKPSLKELYDASRSLDNTSKSLSAAASAIPSVTSDAKAAGPLKSIKAMKSVNYSKKVTTLLTPELLYQTKVISNLIATLKSSGK
jgi:type II secretory pathway pseudopilin PulG